MMDTIENDIEIDEPTVRDILIELAANLKDVPEHEKAGLRAAIEIIEQGYLA